MAISNIDNVSFKGNHAVKNRYTSRRKTHKEIENGKKKLILAAAAVSAFAVAGILIYKNRAELSKILPKKAKKPLDTKPLTPAIAPSTAKPAPLADTAAIKIESPLPLDNPTLAINKPVVPSIEPKAKNAANSIEFLDEEGNEISGVEFKKLAIETTAFVQGKPFSGSLKKGGIVVEYENGKPTATTINGVLRKTFSRGFSSDGAYKKNILTFDSERVTIKEATHVYGTDAKLKKVLRRNFDEQNPSAVGLDFKDGKLASKIIYEDLDLSAIKEGQFFAPDGKTTIASAGKSSYFFDPQYVDIKTTTENGTEIKTVLSSHNPQKDSLADIRDKAPKKIKFLDKNNVSYKTLKVESNALSLCTHDASGNIFDRYKISLDPESQRVTFEKFNSDSKQIDIPIFKGIISKDDNLYGHYFKADYNNPHLENPEGLKKSFGEMIEEFRARGFEIPFAKDSETPSEIADVGSFYKKILKALDEISEAYSNGFSMEKGELPRGAELSRFDNLFIGSTNS